MADQLEIINANGEIEFYTLDAGRGITNIGQHPDNDLVLPGPDVAPFHAMLDHRQRPYQFMLLSPQGQASLAGRPLQPNVSTTVKSWDAIELNAHTLILIADAAGAGEEIPAEPPTAPPVGPRPLQPPTLPVTAVAPGAPPSPPDAYPAAVAPVSEPAPQAPGRPLGLGVLPPDEESEVIVTELSGREWTVELTLGQAATFQVSITNGGDLVASFQVQLIGLPEEWVAFSAGQVNLNPREQKSITVNITPPRHPSSRAGTHTFAIIVTSPHYSGRRSLRGASLIINPYYEFAVSELSPKEQTTSWFNPPGLTSFDIINKGNAVTPFHLEGSDTKQACQFEFDVPGEAVRLAQHAEFQISADSAAGVAVQVAPATRRFIGFRKLKYPFTITTSLVTPQPTSRSLLGQLQNRTLIGPWLSLLALLLVLVTIVLIFRPRVNLFTVEPQLVKAGTPIILRANVSRFARPRIDHDVGAFDQPVVEVTAMPDQDLTYRLEANNWLSQLSPRWFRATAEVRVGVEPVKPNIRVFSVDREAILSGESVMLSWEVENADDVTLQTNGNPDKLLSSEHTGQRTAMLNGNTDYVLLAQNRFGEDTASVSVLVSIPTPTPTATAPPPLVQQFNVDPREITQGESVTLDWNVAQASSVAIDPVSSNLPPNGSISQSPDKTIQYILTASNNNPEQDVRLVREVIVNTPTPTPSPTPEPETPLIEFFQSTKEEVTQGVDDDIELTWSVTGETTDIQISGPDFGPVTGLQPQGSLPAIPAETTIYILTAANGDLSASETVQVKVNPPPTPEPPPPTPTPTPIPPNIVFFAKATDSNEDDKVIQISATEDIKTYEVEGGTKITLSWEVTIADTVILDGFGSLPLKFDQDIPDAVVKNQTFKLTAENAGLKKEAFVNIKALEPEPPPGPFNLSGVEGSGMITLTWQYSSSDLEDIDRFRIYRADVPPGDQFFPQVDVSKAVLVELVDLVNPACGRIYYVVAIYIDLNGNVQETDSSTTTWASKPCP